jgi:hypothetical protein
VSQEQEETAAFLAKAATAIEAIAPGVAVTVERASPWGYRVTLRRGERVRTAELFPGPQDTVAAFEAWAANPDEDPLGLAAWFQALADRITDRPEPVRLTAITLTCPRCGHRDLRRRFPLDYLTAERRCPACRGWFQATA